MKILLITHHLYPRLDAGSEIVYRLAEILVNKYEINVSVLGLGTTEESDTDIPTFPFRTIRIQSIDQYNRIRKKCSNRALCFLKYLKNLNVLRYYIRLKKNEENSLLKEYRRQIQLELKKEKYDCIVGFMHPRYILMALSQIKLKIPFIAYKLDPWSTLHYMINDNKERLREIDADNKASRIIVTELIKKDYKLFESEETLSKIITAEYPNIIKKEKIEILREFQDGRIHCVFAGSLYSDIRNPKYTLELFNKMDTGNVILHILGRFLGDNILPEKLPDNIVYHGAVPNGVAVQYMQSADILVNIGNTVSNLMPSKILTYISLGKPILNIMKLQDCPTLRFTEKYPLALNLLETSEVQQCDVDRVADFIKSNVGKSIPFEEIEKMYETCTPDYVGKQLYDAICEVTGKDK